MAIVDATHLLKETALNTMKDEVTDAPVIRCALDEKRSPSGSDVAAMPSSAVAPDPPFLSEDSNQVCLDPPIWVFDGLLSDAVMECVDKAFEDIEWQPLNGRIVRMVELSVDEQLRELPKVLRQISHIDDVSPCGKAWIMDVRGRNQGPHMDGWEVEKSRRSMQLLDISKCSVQTYEGFSTVIPTLSFVVYFNDSGGIAFPRADLPDPFIPSKRGRIVMFQNYDDSHRPAHNPKAVHYGVYGNTPKRVMTAGVMSSETPLQLSASCSLDAPRTKGFLYAPIMHRANTSCGTPTPPTPPPRAAPKPKPKPVLQLQARSAESGGFIVEASTMAGNVVAKALVQKDATLGSLKKELGVDGQLVHHDEVLNGPDTQKLLDTSLLQGLDSMPPAKPTATTSEKCEKDSGPKDKQPTEVLVEWDVIDTVFVKKETDPKIQVLVDLGVPKEAAEKVLRDAGGDVNRAADSWFG